jgi:mono/diheme cytochrome c family protein
MRSWSVLLGVGLLVTTVWAAEGPRSVWEGVFSAEQVARGKAEFEINCGRCHNNALVGSQSAPPLKGQTFWRHWTGDTVASLFTKIRDSMPDDTIESVSDREKLDILTYILASNGVPTGPGDLQLERTRLESVVVTRDRESPLPPPDSGAVQVSGCLMHAANGRWMLVNATEPEVVGEAEPAVRAPQKDGSRAGGLTYALFSMRPSVSGGQAGRLAKIQGFVLRRPGDNRLTVVSLLISDTICPMP